MSIERAETANDDLGRPQDDVLPTAKADTRSA
jgi:hypothetical protein